MGTQEEEALSEALSPIVNRLIDKNYETSKDKIATQMAPLIGSAIREQIKSQKDDVVDALYPVMGNMISKYVTQSLEDLLNKINTQIQNGLSVATLKRKITAKIKGVSETELLLSENIDSQIQAALLIHKETGLVLSYVETHNQTLSEPEMLASMMTAIRSFINDWVEKNGENQELGEIDYGGNKIIIEASGYSYLAVIVSGATNQTSYNKIRSTLANIVLKHAEAIQEFSGDLNAFPQEEVKKELLELFEEKETTTEGEEEKKKIHPLLYLIPLLLLLWGGYSYYKHYTQEKILAQARTLLSQNPQLTSYKISTVLDNDTLVLKGRVPFAYYKNLASKVLQKVQGLQKLDNEIIVVPTLTDPLQTSTHIAYVLQTLNQQEGIHIDYSYDYDTLTLTGSVWDSTREKKVLRMLSKIKGIKKINNTIAIVPPNISTVIYFKKNSTKLSDAAKKKLINLVKTLHELDNNITVQLTSYSDILGSKRKNVKLSQKRLVHIKNFLKEFGSVTQAIKTEQKDTPPKGVDAKENPQKARCVKISLKKEEK